MHLSSLIWESSFCMGWWLIQRPTTSHDAETLRLQNGQHEMEHHICSFQGLGSSWLKGRKIVKSQRQCITTRKQCFQTQQGSHLYELIALLTEHIRPVQAHSWPNPGTEREWAWNPISVKELLAFDSCWERESQSPLGVWSPVCWLLFSEDHTPKTIWITQIGFDVLKRRG